MSNTGNTDKRAANSRRAKKAHVTMQTNKLIKGLTTVSTAASRLIANDECSPALAKAAGNLVKLCDKITSQTAAASKTTGKKTTSK